MIGYFIWCWNDQEWLPECLGSFRRTTDDVFLVGISNGASDNSVRYLEQFCDLTITMMGRYSIAQCVNLGYQKLYDAGAAYMGFIHPDMRFVQDGWVEPLKDALDTYPQIAKISPQNTREDIPEQWLLKKLIYPGAEAGQLMQRRIWSDIGPYDEQYIGCGGYEDWDMQQRIVEKGLACCMHSESKVWHAHAGTRMKVNEGERNEQWALNQQVYHNRWKVFDYVMAPSDWRDIPLD